MLFIAYLAVSASSILLLHFLMRPIQPRLSHMARGRLPAANLAMMVTPVLPPPKIGNRSLPFKSLILFGAGEGIRTLDPNLGKVVLYP